MNKTREVLGFIYSHLACKSTCVIMTASDCLDLHLQQGRGSVGPNKDIVIDDSYGYRQ